ncbi:MAG: hypothetical protein GY953_44575 [bacterium]|nr:hypothetical protein [bacterium]
MARVATLAAGGRRGTMIRAMSLREQWAERLRQWEAFRQWESRQPPRQVDSKTIVGDLGAIWAWFPEEVRRRDPDPEKTGVQRMRAALAILSRDR